MAPPPIHGPLQCCPPLPNSCVASSLHADVISALKCSYWGGERARYQMLTISSVALLGVEILINQRKTRLRGLPDCSHLLCGYRRQEHRDGAEDHEGDEIHVLIRNYPINL